MSSVDDANAERLCWRPDAWLRAAGHPFTRATLYAEIHRGNIDARKRGKSTLILTSPKAYLESLPKRVGPAVGRAKRMRERKAAEAAA
jgi:hypothetical protein